jgi:hypothetical protein
VQRTQNVKAYGGYASWTSHELWRRRDDRWSVFVRPLGDGTWPLSMRGFAGDWAVFGTDTVLQLISLPSQRVTWAESIGNGARGSALIAGEPWVDQAGPSRIAGAPIAKIPPDRTGDGSIWGSASDDVWSTGASGAIHYDGRRWSPIALDGYDHSDIVWGSSRDDVWLAASGVYHWNGKRLDHQYMPVAIKAFGGSGPDDVWAVGYNADAMPEVLHWNGRAWTSHAGHFPRQMQYRLTKIFATGPNDAWVAGNNGVVLHWDGRLWTELPRAMWATSARSPSTAACCASATAARSSLRSTVMRSAQRAQPTASRQLSVTIAAGSPVAATASKSQRSCARAAATIDAPGEPAVPNSASLISGVSGSCLRSSTRGWSSIASSSDSSPAVNSWSGVARWVRLDTSSHIRARTRDWVISSTGLSSKPDTMMITTSAASCCVPRRATACAIVPTGVPRDIAAELASRSKRTVSPTSPASRRSSAQVELGVVELHEQLISVVR